MVPELLAEDPDDRKYSSKVQQPTHPYETKRERYTPSDLVRTLTKPLGQQFASRGSGFESPQLHKLVGWEPCSWIARTWFILLFLPAFSAAPWRSSAPPKPHQAPCGSGDGKRFGVDLRREFEVGVPQDYAETTSRN